MPVPMAQTAIAKEVGQFRWEFSRQSRQYEQRLRTGLVGNDDVLPVGLLDSTDDGLDLALADSHGLVGLSLLEGLSDAENNLEALADGGRGLLGDGLGRVLEEDSSLRVANQGPVDLGVDEHVRGDLAGEGTLLLGVAVLGRELNLGRGRLSVVLDVLLSGEEVECGDGDDDL